MQNRKILTLEEVLELDRRPTLQEMVDLSVEDYTKYLYKKGIIRYIPESGNLEDYEQDENDEYDFYYPQNDVILELRNGEAKEWYGGVYPCYWDEYDKEDYQLNESLRNSLDEYNVTLYGVDGTEYIYSYSIDEDGDIFYHIMTKDRYNNWLD